MTSEYSLLMTKRRQAFLRGLKDGIPIGLGYLAVSFSLGIAAKNAGLTPFQGLFASLLCNASAGEYVGFTLIAASATYLEIALATLVANARYLLMSCALTQKLRPGVGLIPRLIVGFDVTDEIFGVSIAVPGALDPVYSYGVIAIALPGWAGGTFFGVLMGNLLPLSLVSALSVGLYGMFVAVFIPPARKSRVIAGLVVLSMLLSFLAHRFLAQISSGTMIIVLTVVISAAAALLFPVKEEAV